MSLDEIIELFFENIKHIYFPDNWLQIDLKFSKTEILALVLIEKRREITMTELSEYANTPMSTANGIIERLVKKGYVSRERSETDRRIVVLHLTPDGARLVSWLRDYVSGYLKIALENLSGDEIQTLVTIILKMVRSLQSKMRPALTEENDEVRSIIIE